MSETLEKLSTVNFPRTISEEEAYKILKFVSRDLDYRITGGSFVGYFSIEEGELKGKYEADIKGTISTGNFDGRASFFFSRKIIEHENAFTGIRFFTTHGFRLEQHDKGEVDAWREIKESVSRYFEANRDKAESHPGQLDLGLHDREK